MTAQLYDNHVVTMYGQVLSYIVHNYDRQPHKLEVTREDLIGTEVSPIKR